MVPRGGIRMIFVNIYDYWRCGTNRCQISATSTIQLPISSISLVTIATYPCKIKYFKILPEICCTFVNFPLFHFISFCEYHLCLISLFLSEEIDLPFKTLLIFPFVTQYDFTFFSLKFHRNFTSHCLHCIYLRRLESSKSICVVSWIEMAVWLITKPWFNAYCSRVAYFQV